MGWNYRILKEPVPNPLTPESATYYYRMIEAYYDKHSGRIHRWSAEPLQIFNEDVQDMKMEIQHMLEAFNKPILIQDGKMLVEESKRDG